MADHDSNEKWFEGKSSLFKSRAERVKADIARRKAGRKAIKGEDVKVEWEEQNGVWMGPLVSQELGFQNRIIEVDCHIYPPHSHSVTHKHNEASSSCAVRVIAFSTTSASTGSPATRYTSAKACGTSTTSPATKRRWCSRSSRY